MAKDRTPESGVPLYKRAQRMVGRGRGADIALPRDDRETRDPRLPADPADTGRAVRAGFEAVRKLSKRSGASRSKR